MNFVGCLVVLDLRHRTKYLFHRTIEKSIERIDICAYTILLHFIFHRRTIFRYQYLKLGTPDCMVRTSLNTRNIARNTMMSIVWKSCDIARVIGTFVRRPRLVNESNHSCISCWFSLEIATLNLKAACAVFRTRKISPIFSFVRNRQEST